MENKSFDVVLDIEKDLYNATNQLFDISQNDLNDINLNLIIKNNGAAFDLTGTTVELAVRKPSGLTTYTAATITNAVAGEASIMLGIQSYVEYGIYKAEVNIRTADAMAVTCPFWYSVREAIMNTTAMPTINDWTALQQALFGYDYKPIIVDGVPTAVPEYIGQMAFDTTGQRAFISYGLDAASWMQLGVSATGGTSINWADILGKPATFPPDAHTHAIADVIGLQADLDAKANAADLANYLTGAEADARYEPIGSTPDMTGYLTETDAAATYQPIGDYLTTAAGDARYEPIGSTPDMTGYLTETEGDARYLAITTDLFTQTEADARYQQIGTDVPDDWAAITNKPATFPPSAHQHTSADITDFATAVAADIPAEYLTQTEGDARYNLKGTSGTASSVDWGNVTGDITAQVDLQNALAAKADDSDLTGLLSQTDADARYQQIGTDVPDDWADITNKPATFPPSPHTHVVADITDFATGVGANIPAEYLTQTEGDARYQAIGTAPDMTGYAPLASPAFTGTPTAPTPTTGDNTTAIATTAFVQSALPDTTGMLTQTDADARYQQIGTDTPDDWTEITNKPATFPPSAHTHAVSDVTGLQTDLDAKAPIASPTFTGTPTAPTATAGTNTTQIATTAFVQAALPSTAGLAPLASPTFTGTPAAPTPATADNTTKIATTAFVKAQGYLTSAPAPNWGGIGGTLANQTDLQTALNAKAPLASPALTGTPTAPTATAGTNTTQIATTAFVQAALPNTAALAPLASPAFTGTPTAPTPAAADNSTALATTAFVAGQGFMKSLPLMTTAAVGGAQVGNGLTMSGNYLLVKTGASLGINGTNSALQVQDQNGTPITFWRGTQAAYDAIATKDANTLYFISG